MNIFMNRTLISLFSLLSIVMPYICKAAEHKQVPMTPLMIESNIGDFAKAKELIDAGVNVNEQHPGDGLTALMYAVGNKHHDIVRLLLDSGANPDIQGIFGRTALILAIELGYVDIIKLLLNAHARIDIQDNKERTALTIAAEKNRIDIVELLLQALGAL